MDQISTGQMQSLTTVLLLVALRLQLSAAKSRELVIPLTVCAAQPFLEKYLNAYADACKLPQDDMYWVVELWDGSVLSAAEFHKYVALDKKVFGKGTWQPNSEGTRLEFTSLDHLQMSPDSVQKLEKSVSLGLRHPTDMECMVSKIMTNDDVLNIAEQKQRFSFDVRYQENSKDIGQIKNVVRQLVGLRMLSTAQMQAEQMEKEEEELSEEMVESINANLLQAWKMMDVFDHSYKDSQFFKFKNKFNSFAHSSVGRGLYNGAMEAATCAITAFGQKNVDPQCFEVLSTIAQAIASRMGMGSPSTYRIRALVDFVSSYLNTLTRLVEEMTGGDEKMKTIPIVETAMSQVQCVLTLFGTYFDHKSPPKEPLVYKGKKYKYHLSLGKSIQGFATEQLQVYDFSKNLELTQDMIKEVVFLQQLLSQTVQLLELKVTGESRSVRGVQGRIRRSDDEVADREEVGAGEREEVVVDEEKETVNKKPKEESEDGGTPSLIHPKKHQRRKHWPIDGRLKNNF